MDDKQYSWQLCFVDDKQVAYFTNANPRVVHGDDWQHAPASTNAGRPQYPEYAEFLKMMYDADLVHNCEYSALDINAGIGYWLTSWPHDEPKVQIRGGCTVRQFIQQVETAGGHVYAPMQATTEQQKHTLTLEGRMTGLYLDGLKVGNASLGRR